MTSLKWFIPLIFSLPVAAQACTLWGATGSASADGTLLAKNRDWVPDHIQTVRLVHPDSGLSYVGLFAAGHAPGLKEGVNSAGLSVVSASASSLPRAERKSGQGHHLLKNLLTHYHSLDEVATDAASLFSSQRPAFLILADAHGLMRVEIGLNGHYSVTRTTEGTLAQTNHYLDNEAIGPYAQKPGASSRTRYNRVQTLLAGHPGPHTLEEFAQISADHQDGPDNSLQRNGREYTLSSWRIALPAFGPPQLQLTLFGVHSDPVSNAWRLDANFWDQPAGVLAGGDKNPVI